MHPLILLQSASLQAFGDHLRAWAASAGDSALAVLLATVVMLVGWLVARLVAWGALGLLRAVRFNQAVGRLRLGGTVSGIEPARMTSWSLYWLVLLFAVMLAGDALGLELSSAVASRLRDVLPRVATGTIEMVVGLGVAMALGGVTRRVFATAGVGGSRVRGRVVTGVLSAFAVLLALEQIGLAAQFVMALGVTAMAALGLAAALAFGLGCRELARDFVVEVLRASDDAPATEARTRT
jgi:hypothetical protein